MKVIETCDKYTCNECGEYDYVFDIFVANSDEFIEDGEDYSYPSLRLCKKCLIKLWKAILER